MSYNDEKEQKSTADVHIGVLYSYGPHFRKALEGLRERYPNGKITAIVPPGFPEEAVGGTAARILPYAPVPEARRTVRQTWQLLRRIRAENFDIFVVLFGSLKLQLLARFSGADACFCFGLDNTLRPVQVRPVHMLANAAKRRIAGEITYWRIWMHVKFHSVPPHDSETGDSENGRAEGER